MAALLRRRAREAVGVQLARERAELIVQAGRLVE